MQKHPFPEGREYCQACYNEAVVRIILPAPALREFVFSYWFIQDLRGVHRGRQIRTVPHAAAVLTVNLAQPNSDSRGDPVPVASLLGIQSQSRLGFRDRRHTSS